MKIDKKITFIYEDLSDAQQLKPIYEEAKNRGYEVKMTTDFFEKCEIGVYCQHYNCPSKSKLSIVTLHDIGQTHGDWPNIWLKEPWNIFDIAIVPGKRWSDMWKESSKYSVARPKIGTFEIGWPKADVVSQGNFIEEKAALIKQLGIDEKKPTVLYAPSWENDGKEDDYVQALLNLDVNILIKQYYSSSPKYNLHNKNAAEMKELHKDLPNVHIIEPTVNIFNAIALCDLMVSDESSTMFEAMLMGIPSVAVTDWKVLFGEQSVPSCVPFDFVVKTEKSKLQKCVLDILSHIEDYKQKIIEYRDSNFKNIGQTSKLIMDLIDAVREEKDLPMEPLEPSWVPEKVPFKVLMHLKIRRFKTYILLYYCFRNPLINKVYRFYRKCIGRPAED